MLWRHGRTDWNGERRFQGHTDIPLNELGRDQAARAAPECLARVAADRIVASDMSRALDTARDLGAPGRRRCRARTSRFGKPSGGKWEGQRDTDLAADPQYLAWSAGEDVPAGGAERRSDVAARASAALRKAIDDMADGDLLVVVTHGGTIRCLLGSMLDLPVDQWRVFGGLANCCWSVIEEGRIWLAAHRTQCRQPPRGSPWR